MNLGGKQMLSRKDLAKVLNVTERTIDRYRKDGMPCYTLPTGTIRFKLDEVMAWLEKEE